MDITPTASRTSAWSLSDLLPSVSRSRDSGTEAGAADAPAPSTVVTLSGQAPDVDAQEDSDATPIDGQPSAVKSFTYGALGLGVPKSEAEIQAQDPEQKKTEDYYSAGRIAVSALAIGTMLSVLI